MEPKDVHFTDLPHLSADGETVSIPLSVNGGAFVVELRAGALRAMAFKALRSQGGRAREASGGLIVRQSPSFVGMAPMPARVCVDSRLEAGERIRYCGACSRRLALSEICPHCLTVVAPA